ncbi:MAG: LysR substrate-binding domain-containing protein [Hyphomonadaceae bacterium]
MKLNQIRDVVIVAERGSLRSAARHLGVAQPSITRNIRELEHELGVELFERRVSGMVLTPLGEAFVRRAAAIQLDLERARDEIQQLKGVATGAITVALSTAAHLAMLPRILPPFVKRFPDVRVKIVEGLFPAMEAGLHDGAIDFYVGPLGENSMVAELVVERLFDNFRMVVCRRNHPLAGAKSLAELSGARWVATSVTWNPDAELGPIFERHNLPVPRISVEAQTGLSMMLVAAHSDLLAMLPRQWQHLVDVAGLLQRIDVKETLAAPTICIARRARLPLTPAAEHLCDLVRRAGLQDARAMGVAAGAPRSDMLSLQSASVVAAPAAHPIKSRRAR